MVAVGNAANKKQFGGSITPDQTVSSGRGGARTPDLTDVNR